MRSAGAVRRLVGRHPALSSSVRCSSSAAVAAPPPGSSSWQRAALALGLAGAGLAAAVANFAPSLPSAQSEAAERVALDANEWKPFKLKERITITHNTKLFRFELPEKDMRLGLPIASCLLTKAPGKDEQGNPKPVIRPYTPTSDPDDRGHFDLVIKVYDKGVMSQHIDKLQPGDVLEVKGPIPKLPIKENMKKEIGMVAGGTGIAPMLQVVNAITKNPNDKTKVSLVFANVSEDDILLKGKIDAYAAKNPNFKVFYVVNKATSSSWKGGVGFVTKDMLKDHLPEPSDDNLVLVCGPPGMMKAVSGEKKSPKDQGELEGLLKDLGYTKDQVYKF